MNAFARLGLLIAYAVLFLAALGRSTVQLTTRAADAPVAYSLSAAAAVLYGVIAMALWRGRRRLALVGTAVELAGVVAVGAWTEWGSGSWPDQTVWTGFGSGYGWIPLALPILALWALLRAPRDGAEAAGT